MRLKDTLKINLQYLKNSIRQISRIVLMIFFSLTMLLTILNLSSTIQNTIDMKMNKDFILTPINNDSALSNLKDEILTNEQLDELNNKYKNIGKITRNTANPTLTAYSINTETELPLSFSKMNSSEVYSSTKLNVISINDSLLENGQLSINDSLLIDNVYYVIIAVHASFKYDADILFPEAVYNKLKNKEFSNLLKLSMENSSNYNLNAQNILIELNTLIGNAKYKYQLTNIDFTAAIGLLLNMITNFLLIIAIIVFFISMMSISSIVNISVIERREEFVILGTFGLSKREITKLIIVEIVMLLSFALLISIGFCIIITYIVSLILNTSMFLAWYKTIFVVVFTLTIGFISSIISARNAVKYNIIDI